MAGVSYTIEDQEVRGALARLNRVADNPAPALNAIGAYGVFSTQRRFEMERGPDGAPWRPLSARTANRRVGGALRGTEHILRQSGRLYQSLAYQASPGAVEWGSNIIYARIHQLGGVIDMPARQQRLTMKRIRRKGGGFKSRFARANAKGATSQTANIGAHQIRIPARPYLGLSEEDRDEIIQITQDHLRDEAGQNR